jgi:hypothetical protein
MMSVHGCVDSQPLFSADEEDASDIQQEERHRPGGTDTWCNELDLVKDHETV